MDVTAVRFEAFKSLYGVSCDLDHLTVLTGPNGSGKSNVVEALHFLGEVYAHGLEFAVSRAGGYDNIAHRRTRRAKRPVSVMVEVTVTAADIQRSGARFLRTNAEVPNDFLLKYRHTFAMKTAGQRLSEDFTVSADRIEISDKQDRLIASVTSGQDGNDGNPHISTWASRAALRDPLIDELIQPLGDKRFKQYGMRRPFQRTSLVSDEMYYAALLYMVKRALAGTRVFQLSPYQCRGSGVSTPNAVLERHGENLPGAADHLRRNDRDGWRQVQSAMRTILPALVSIDIVHTEDRRLALQLREHGVGRAWNTGEVSDGTIQTLALLIALYDRRNPLLVIEEPENSVHPWILRRFLDLAKAAPGKQIVMTTHSPVLLNYVDPEIVRLVRMRNGRSEVSRLLSVSPDLRPLILAGELDLFDAYDSGVLVEAVPRGLAPSVGSQDEDEIPDPDDDE